VDGTITLPQTAGAASAGADAAQSRSEAQAPKLAYPPAAALPTQVGPRGLRFDFNDGCRIMVPEGEDAWRVRISDLDTGNVLYETELKAGRVSSTKRYYIRFRLEVWQQATSVLAHEYAAEGRRVLINFPIGTLGDTLGWFPYAVKFRQQHKCRLTCAMAERLIPLFQATHPDIELVSHEAVEPERYYATYNIGLFFDDKDLIFQPCDFRLVGLHRTAGYILGVDPTEIPAKIALEDETRPLDEPYACIATQPSTQSK
jgi:autotransporter strand-loop-strand O-heptosyltransferase